MTAARALRAGCWLLAAGLAANLTACASVDPAVPLLVGRLSVTVAAAPGQAARGFNAGFELQGDARRGELRLSSVLGPQLAAARWSPAGASLVESGREQRFDSLDQLSQKVLGEVLPLQALPDWLRGRPWTGAEHQADGTGFRQLGWVVDATRLDQGFVNAHRAVGPTGPEVNLKARLENPL